MVARLVGQVALLSILLLGMLAGFSRTPNHLSADTDLSGNWGFMFGARFAPDLALSIDCIASVVQKSSHLTAEMSCESSEYVTFVGVLNAADGSVDLAGQMLDIPFTAQGSVGYNGTHLGGTWNAVGTTNPLNGTFEGSRGLNGRGQVTCPPPLPVVYTQPIATASSLDAVLILQYAAGLVQSLPCLYLADVNVDGAVTATDAFLVLEYTAGIIEEFPPP
jgi:hypothetical protein